MLDAGAGRLRFNRSALPQAFDDILSGYSQGDRLGVAFTREVEVAPLQANVAAAATLAVATAATARLGQASLLQGTAEINAPLFVVTAATARLSQAPPLHTIATLTPTLQVATVATGRVASAFPPVRAEASLTLGLAVATAATGHLDSVRAVASILATFQISTGATAQFTSVPPLQASASLSLGLQVATQATGQIQVPLPSAVILPTPRTQTLISIYLEGIVIGNLTFSEDDNLHIWNGEGALYEYPNDVFRTDQLDGQMHLREYTGVGYAIRQGVTENRSEVLDKRLEIEIGIDESNVAARTALRQDLGAPQCQRDIIYTHDGGLTWNLAPTRHKGRMSTRRFEKGIFRFEIESSLSGLVRDRTETYGDERQRTRVVGVDTGGDPILNADDRALEFLETMEAGYESAFPHGFRPANPLKVDG